MGPHGLPFLPSPALPSPPNQQQPQPPCSTLFVANLGQFVSDHELKDIFARSVVTVNDEKRRETTKNNTCTRVNTVDAGYLDCPFA